MRAFRRNLCALLIFEILSCCLASSQGTPSLTYTIRAKDFDSSDSALLLVTSDIPAASKEVDVHFVSPTNFVLDQTDLKFTTGRKIVPLKLSRTQDTVSGDYLILAQSVNHPADGSTPFETDQAINFSFNRRLQIWSYLLLGLIGFAIGYFIRLMTSVLKKIPAPAPAPVAPGADQDGPITVFVKAHYYMVDFAVSIVLAFAVLLYLLKDGHPPDSATAWYGALLTGIGLGFLTNNDLLARIKT
ncbi:MAG TPA: hypothetical protein VLK33_13345 [Terriglobales bacterium]|nr:hypothetical protein [Terriglobales bacterium]